MLFYKEPKGYIGIDIFSYIFVIANLAYFSISFVSKKINLDEVLREDYIFEWATFIFLILISVIFSMYSYKFRRHKSYLMMFAFCAIVFLFGALEEVSWFQRTLGYSGAEVIVKNNAQGEFNIHNLMIGDKSVNRLIFGKVLGVLIGIYFLIPSLVKEFSDDGRLFLKGVYFPTPYMRDLTLILITISTVYLYLDFPKQGEILEYLLSFQLLTFYMREYLKLNEL